MTLHEPLRGRPWPYTFEI